MIVCYYLSKRNVLFAGALGLIAVFQGTAPGWEGVGEVGIREKEKKKKSGSETLSLAACYSRTCLKHWNPREGNIHAFLSVQGHCVQHSYLPWKAIIALLCLFLKNKSQ